MRKKILSMIVATTMILGVFFVIPIEEVKAAEEKIAVDGTVLLDDAEESIGEMIPITKGQYLQTGSSRIGQIGTGKIKVSATTIAQKKVSTIKTAVMVERLVNGSWLSYTSWTATKTDAYSLTTAKEMVVPRGYYYRVRTVHVANSDVSNSNTNALYVN